MNKREAMRAMLDGKKVRPDHWSKGYLFLDENCDMRCNEWDHYEIGKFNNSMCWDIVKEPVKYSVEVWLDEKPYHCPTGWNLGCFLFGDSALWSNAEDEDNKHRYRITVEELVDD